MRTTASFGIASFRTVGCWMTTVAYISGLRRWSGLGRTNRTALAGAGKGTPMLRVVEERDEAKGEVRSALDELALEGARRMLAEALDVEVAAYLERHRQGGGG